MFGMYLFPSVSDTHTHTHTQRQPRSAICSYHSMRGKYPLVQGKSRSASSTSSWDDYMHGKRGFRLPPTHTDTHTDASTHTNPHPAVPTNRTVRPRRILWITVPSKHIWGNPLPNQPLLVLSPSFLPFLLVFFPFLFLFACQLTLLLSLSAQP